MVSFSVTRPDVTLAACGKCRRRSTLIGLKREAASLSLRDSPPAGRERCCCPPSGRATWPLAQSLCTTKSLHQPGSHYKSAAKGHHRERTSRIERPTPHHNLDVSSSCCAHLSLCPLRVAWSELDGARRGVRGWKEDRAVSGGVEGEDEGRSRLFAHGSE